MDPLKTKRIRNLILYIFLPLFSVLYICILLDVFTINPIIKAKLDDKNVFRIASEERKLDDITAIYEKGDIVLAQKKLLEFTEKHKEYYMAWTLLGMIYSQQGNDEKAQEALNNAIIAKNNAPEPHFLLGSIYLDKNDYKKANEEFLIANTIAPNDPSTITSISVTFYNMDSITKALHYGKQAFELDSTNARICSHLALCYKKNMQLVDYKKMYNKAVELENKSK